MQHEDLNNGDYQIKTNKQLLHIASVADRYSTAVVADLSVKPQ